MSQSPKSRYPARRARPDNRQGKEPGVATRRAALRLLDAVLRRGEPLELALHGAGQGLTAPDRALVHAIAAATLRHLPALDALIDSATRDPLPEDAKARAVLRIALAQHLVLETPAHAVVATALPLVDGGPRRLVHGVLGALIRGEARLPERTALPADTAARWTEAWGEDAVAALGVALGTRAPIDLTLADATQTREWAERLGGTSLLPGHVRLPADTVVPDLPGFEQGAWWVQDLAASIPARLAGAGNGAVAIDLCAAPGGKTMQLASAGWTVTAIDRSAKRLERLSDNLARARLAARTAAADALEWAPPAPAPLVLLDAPCSATGIFRRHPDVLYRSGSRQIVEMAELQSRLLDRAATMAAPGGRLIYATCSLEPAEGEEQIRAFLDHTPGWTIVAPGANPLPAGIAPSPDGTIRTRPDMVHEAGGMDGFFIAMLARAS